MSAALLILFLSLPSRAQTNEISTSALQAVRVSASDVSVRSDRYPTAMRLWAVENGLRNPLSRLRIEPKGFAEQDVTLDSLAGAAMLLLEEDPPETPSAPSGPALPAGLQRVAKPIGRLLAAITAARADLARSVSSLSPVERARALELVRAWVTNGSPEPTLADIRVLERFDHGAALSAACRILNELEPAAEALVPKEEGHAFPRRMRVHLEGGDLLVAGPGDDEYTAEDLEGVSLLVDLGGRSRYLAAPAAAGEGEVRVVLDLSSEVQVLSDSGTASGTFGIGVLALPRAQKGVVLRGGDFSLGAGLFGVGAVLLNGEAKVVGGKFSQGAGAFGMGLFLSRGEASSFQVRMAGQGFGFTHGVGIFSHAGGGAHFDGGLVEPDPREPLAALSMSQGFGLGPRAWMAGGIGIAAVRGNDCSLDASYMAQGAGYWHSAGILSVEGDRCRVQGRRYVQGAGVHTALGSFFLRGSDNRSIVWGAGPALGWDYGVGLLDVQGSSNSFQGEWATLRGDVNGHSLTRVRGNGNRLDYPEPASGALKRGAPSYGLLEAVGTGNNWNLPASTPTSGTALAAADPWSVSLGLGLSSAPAPAATEWPSVERAPAFLAERERLQELLRKAEILPSPQRSALWLRAAASAGLDGQTGFAAAAMLASLPKDARTELVRLVSAEGFDENLWLSTLIPSFGRAMARTILIEISSASPPRRVVLAGLLRFLPAEEAAGPAMDLASAEDWHLRRAAAGTLGALLGRQGGQEPGRIRLLESARRFALAPADFAAGSKKEEEWVRSLAEQRLSDLYALLALGDGMSPDERVGLLRAAGNPFAALPPDAFKVFALILAARPSGYAAALGRELVDCAAQEESARAVLRKMLADPEPEVAQAAIVALASIGREDDASALSSFLSAPSAYLRESAAAGLGRMGLGGRKALRTALKSTDSRVRELAAVGIGQTTEPEVLFLLERAFKDREPSVRRAALVSLLSVQSPLRGELRRFIKELRRIEKEDSDASVRLAAARASRAIAP